MIPDDDVRSGPLHTIELVLDQRSLSLLLSLF